MIFICLNNLSYKTVTFSKNIYLYKMFYNLTNPYTYTIKNRYFHYPIYILMKVNI